MTKTAIEIRRAAHDDWRAVKRVRLAALQQAPYAFGSTFEGERDRTAAEWQRFIVDGERPTHNVIYIAYRGAEQVGLAGAFHESKTSVMLVSMWVSPTARRTGAGRLLTRAILEWAAEVRARKVTLWVADDNPEAIALYEATGFIPTGKHTPMRSAPQRQMSEFARKPR
ncbi:MAG: GNAT family N-acetyltransferase [Candidatus Limnocylindrales bacterium]